ncbi:MAG: tetratricopeptide repeat protein [Deltaproteobacteria bacterium]|nr:tetratricopeptide repeat protein [Deltaproteobacteria bacterium]
MLKNRRWVIGSCLLAMSKAVNSSLKAVAPHCLLPIACLILCGCGGHQIIITKDPLKADEHIKLAQVYEAKGETELAVKEYKTALEQDKTNSMAYFGLGNISFKKGKYGDAEDYYKKAIENAPADDQRNAMFYNNLSCVYIEANKDLKEAERLVQRALLLDAERAGIYQDTLGVIYTKLKEYEKAEEAFSSALQNTHEDTAALRYIYQHLSELYRLQGNKDKLHETTERLKELGK